MIVSDCSKAFPKEAEQLKERLKRLYALQDAAQTDREWNLLNYLVRRAWRPLYGRLKSEYIKLWGKNASFSYFFPEHTFNAIAWQARKEMQP